MSYETRPSQSTDLAWTGYNGRCNKIADTCYAFWVGASLNVRFPFSFAYLPACCFYW